MNVTQRQALSEVDGFLASLAGSQNADASALRSKVLKAFPLLTGSDETSEEDHLTQQQKAAAFDNMMSGLKDLGFGTDEPINGADVIDAINELIGDTESRYGV